MTTIPCPECGVHVSAGSRECPDCGHVLAKTMSATAIALLVLALGVVLATVIWFANTGFSDLDLGF